MVQKKVTFQPFQTEDALQRGGGIKEKHYVTKLQVGFEHRAFGSTVKYLATINQYNTGSAHSVMAPKFSPSENYIFLRIIRSSCMDSSYRHDVGVSSWLPTCMCPTCGTYLKLEVVYCQGIQQQSVVHLLLLLSHVHRGHCVCVCVCVCV